MQRGSCRNRREHIDDLRSVDTGKPEPAGAVIDAAMNAIGQILENTLQKSTLTWDTAKFTVYTNFQNKKVPEFQLIYIRPALDDADFFSKIDRKHFDNNALMALAQSIWLSRAANVIQGVPAAPPMRVASAGRPQLQYTDSLVVGGYARADGTMCPVSYIRETYTEDIASASTPAPAARSPYLPSFPTEAPWMRADREC